MDQSILGQKCPWTKVSLEKCYKANPTVITVPVRLEQILAVTLGTSGEMVQHLRGIEPPKQSTYLISCSSQSILVLPLLIFIGRSPSHAQRRVPGS